MDNDTDNNSGITIMKRFLIAKDGSTLTPDQVLEMLVSVNKRIDEVYEVLRRHDLAIQKCKRKPKWNKLRGIWNIIKS